MGLTVKSTGFKTCDNGLCLQKRTPQDKVIAVAGNPNVGKSTLFNALTGLKQHTGNWAGKTISSAQGYCKSDNYSYVLVDIPGTCSLVPHSAEEEVASDFLCFGEADGVVVVCDGTCLERGMNLLLQVLTLTSQVVLCVNLMDEAARRNIRVDLNKLEQILGIPVIGTVAHSPQARQDFLNALDRMMASRDSSFAQDTGCGGCGFCQGCPMIYQGSAGPQKLQYLSYEAAVEEALNVVEEGLSEYLPANAGLRWLSLMLLEKCYPFTPGQPLPAVFSTASENIQELYDKGWEILLESGYTPDTFSDMVITQTAHKAAEICAKCCTRNTASAHTSTDRRLDKLLTSPLTGYPIMILFLLFLFWITIVGANYPSQLLSWVFERGEEMLDGLLVLVRLPDWLREALVYGVFRTVGWVVSVMLPPMMIFFPLFTLLEDAGYLPRIAYNLDYCFQKCHSCGKQALTMSMGFGCNAAGVVGCRIIDSPRERLIAILTNSFVPCNGRFPMLIAMISMFLLPVSSSLLGALCLTVLILLGILMTFLSSALLSSTALKGLPSSFVLELPPFRRPKIGSVIVHSLTDRVSFLLGRALLTAAPAGLLLFIMANVSWNGTPLLTLFSSLLDPFARLLGLDGVILMAFILGLPANEIVLPIILMAYASQGSLQQLSGYTEMRSMLIANGWTWQTAVSTCLFSLMHWPCATTLLTIRKESGSMKWTLLSILLPLAWGVLLCMVFTAIAA